jgi:hypothetical protein
MQKRLSSLGSALATRSLSVFLHHIDNEGKFSSKLFFEYNLQFENHVVIVRHPNARNMRIMFFRVTYHENDVGHAKNAELLLLFL